MRLERQGARQGRLEADAAALHPRQAVLRDDRIAQAREALVGLAIGHTDQVVKVFVLAVGLDQVSTDRGPRCMQRKLRVWRELPPR